MALALTTTHSGIIQSDAFTEQGASQSGESTEQEDSQSQNVLQAAFGIIAGSAFVFNLMFCVVLLKKRTMLKKPHNSLLFNLAITDLLTGILLAATPGYVIDKRLFPVPEGLGGHVFCALFANRYLLFAVAKASISLVTCLAVERWYCVKRPVKYKKHFGGRRLIIYIVLLWFVSCALQSHKFMELKLVGNECVAVSIPYGKEGAQVFIAIYSFSCFVIPCLVTWLTFAHIRCRLVVPNTSPKSERRERQQKLVLHMCALTAIVITLCWFPAQLSYTLTPFGITSVNSPFHKACNVIAFLNSCINPLIYWYYHKEYRKEFIKLFCVYKQSRKGFISKNKTPQSDSSTAQDVCLRVTPIDRW